MTQQEFIENIRQEVREEGYMAATKLVARIAGRAKEFEVNANALEILAMIPCDDIHIVEYANWLTKDYRRKDLFYFLPEG